MPITTSDEVKSRPARRENISELYPRTTIPKMAPMSNELLIRVFIPDGYPSGPSNFLKMTLVGFARLF